jgi:hypothetical protein
MPAKPHERPYPALSPDTDRDAERVQIEIFRRMPAWRKAQLVADANEVARQLALAGLRQRHPQAGREELRRRLLGLFLGEELATRVYGPLPEGRQEAPAR